MFLLTHKIAVAAAFLFLTVYSVAEEPEKKDAPAEDHSKATEDEQRRAYALNALVKLQGVDALTSLLEKLYADKGERMRLRETAQVLLKKGSDPE